MSTELTWTNSSLTALQDCGEKFRRRYVEREYRPPSTRLLRGTVIHTAVGAAMLRKLKGADLPSVEEVADTAASSFGKAWSEGVALQPDEAELGKDAVRDRVKDMVVNLSVLHRTQVAPTIAPVGVEHRITVKPQDMDITIQGTIDLAAQRPTGVAIHDTKSGEKSPAKDMADDSQQFSMYGLLWLYKTGQLPVDYEQNHLVQTPAKKDLKHVTLNTTRDLEDMRTLVERLNTGVAAVAKGTFVPASPSSWWCDPKWCEFHGDCVYQRRGGNRPSN